jgi:hypothetical protein
MSPKGRASSLSSGTFGTVEHAVPQNDEVDGKDYSREVAQNHETESNKEANRVAATGRRDPEPLRALHSQNAPNAIRQGDGYRWEYNGKEACHDHAG